MSVLLAAVALVAILLATYKAGFRAGEIKALKVPLRHNADRELVQGQLRLLAADTREPVALCRVDFILIGPDGGDGGFQMAISDRRGIVKLPAYLSPGRYQIEIDPVRNADKRLVHTSYSSANDYLLIRPDKTYSPFEYVVDVQPPPASQAGG